MYVIIVSRADVTITAANDALSTDEYYWTTYTKLSFVLPGFLGMLVATLLIGMKRKGVRVTVSLKQPVATLSKIVLSIHLSRIHFKERWFFMERRIIFKSPLWAFRHWPSLIFKC